MPSLRASLAKHLSFWLLCGLLASVVVVSGPAQDQAPENGEDRVLAESAEELRREVLERMTSGGEPGAAVKSFVHDVVRRALVDKHACPTGLQGSPVCGSVPHDLWTLGPIVEDVAIDLVNGGSRVLDVPYVAGPERLAPFGELGFQRLELWIDRSRVRIWIENSSPFHKLPGPKKTMREIVISIEPSTSAVAEFMPADP